MSWTSAPTSCGRPWAEATRWGSSPPATPPAQRLESAQKGSQQLAAILRQETWFVLGSDKELSEAGYLCWSPSLG